MIITPKEVGIVLPNGRKPRIIKPHEPLIHPRIVEAVGFATRHGGRTTTQGNLRRALCRLFANIAFKMDLSPSYRKWAFRQAMELFPVQGGSKGNAFETDLLELLFNATALADLAENDSTSPSANISVALHTGDPGEAGTQLTNEAAYTSYARENVARTGGGWSVSGGSVSPVANIDFTEATGGSETETHFSVGSGVSNYLMYSGTITPNIAVSSGVTPRLTTATAITED